jgi:hypothetical protein
VEWHERREEERVAKPIQAASWPEVLNMRAWYEVLRDARREDEVEVKC